MTMKNVFAVLAFFLATGFSMAAQEKPQEKKDDLRRSS